MTSKLTPYPQPFRIHSALLKNPPEALPSIEDLEHLHVELRELKKKTADRARKAGEDLKSLEESFRRLREKEKGKARATERDRRGRDDTPSHDVDEAKLSAHSRHAAQPRLGSHPLNSGPPSSSRSSLDPRRSVLDDSKKKKKKRKREDDEELLEPELQRQRKGTPPVQIHPPPPPPKPQKSTISVAQPHSKVSTPSGPDFNLHPSSPLLPPRPPIPPLPVPGPSKPTEVVEDFSKLKQPQQIVATSFYTSIEPWIRPIREEDVGYLEYTADEIEPYILPKLGRHYTEVWEEQDAGLYPASVVPEQQDAPPSTFEAPTQRWDPSTLTEPDLLNEEKGHAPLTERVISALLPMPDHTVWKGVKAAEDAMEGRPGGSGAAAARREKMNVNDLEVRIRDTMRLHGLLDGIPDFTEKVDDPIATALRHAQRELRQVVATNKARKARLIAIARDRLGHQEYLELRDSIDKNINTTYSKLQKKDAPKLNKKKKKPAPTDGSQDGVNGGPNGQPIPTPAALGLISDEDNRLHVNDQLRHLVDTRRQWVDTVGAVFSQKQRDSPGRIWGLPKQSVYMGIDDEVQDMLVKGPEVANLASSSKSRPGGGMPSIPRTIGPANGKGKERARSDAMDVG
ncbi:hypothetical protein BDN72DRAFT_799637 [Pluteus cervinus]|uniref:Uncharacterized protein n=1 Tax=Pluteus cervinus TaxID=181527 RepID=A0ACD3AMN5_9AGAR|nr:hypothetical protein BDN72DRAFT_799637 [Pluteus cervinus]